MNFTLLGLASLGSTLVGSTFLGPMLLGGSPIEVYGLELPVADIGAAERAYREAFGFQSTFSGGEVARLEKDGLVLVLTRARGPKPAEGAANVHLNLEVADLGLALERALAAGFDAPTTEPAAIPIGRALTVIDVDGYATNLIDLDAERGQQDDALSVFNVGLELEPEVDWEFLTQLGFEILTRDYVPDALPIVKSGAAELVLHRTARAPRAAGTRAAGLLLACERLAETRAALPRGFCDERAAQATPQGLVVPLRAPSGVRVELLERGPAQLAFERLCALAGSWEGRSSAGWTSRSELEVIARGSALLERTNFEAHPGETMLTLFHKDGSELVLTHYCVAGNQPRLVAREITPDGLHFVFRDATNIASRDQGHMDEARFHFEGPDAFSSRWSFYQDGATSWMEEIHYRRRGLTTVEPAQAKK
jgi:predicted enzyme related to lactoylglutathione lyase